MATCYFCGDDLKPGSGKMKITKEDTVRYYCSRKCEINDRMRDRKNVRWTATYKQLKERRLKTEAGKIETAAQEKKPVKETRRV